MKKVIAILLTMALLTSLSTVFADINWGSQTLNEGETAGYALSMFLGDPMIIDVKKDDSLDDINARYLYINYKALGYDLCAAVRVSDTQMYFWGLDLSPDNLMKAKLVLDDDAPECYVMSYEGDKLKDLAIYIRDFSSNYTYDEFKDKVENITSALSSGDMNVSARSADPILACFPGLSWGMTKDEMINTVGKDVFTELETEAGTTIMASPEILGEKVTVLFMFNNEKVNMLTATIGKENNEKYLEALTQAYGSPHQTTLIGAINGRLMDIEDDPNGDHYAWKTDKSLIILDDLSVQYWSLY